MTDRDVVKTRRPVSRVLSPHFWVEQPFLCDACHHAPDATHPGHGPETAHTRPLFGLAPGGVYLARPVTRPAVGSYPTLSPLPLAGRSTLCGTFPRLAPGGRYPPPCLHGARTFLQQASLPATAQPSGDSDISQNQTRHQRDRHTGSLTMSAILAVTATEM